MRFNKNLLTATLLTVAGLTAISSANAADPIITTFDISLVVTALCEVSTANPIVLDTIVANDKTARTGTTTFNVACSKDTPYGITMSSGAAGTGILTGAAADPQTLKYDLSNTLGGTAWDATVMDNKLGLGFTETPEIYEVFVAVTGDMNAVKPDTYSDTVTVTLAY